VVIVASIALDSTGLPPRLDGPEIGWPYPFPLTPDTLWFRLRDIGTLMGVVVPGAAHCEPRRGGGSTGRSRSARRS
jgi:hypothetical protein